MMYELSRKRVVMFVGAFGSGKTEIAINYALYCKNIGQKVSLVDFDLVTPYFRVRNVQSLLNEPNIEVIQPPKELSGVDLPVYSPRVLSVLRNQDTKLIIDVGGDEIGSRPLGSLGEQLKQNDYDAFLVVNAHRPFTSNPEKIQKVMNRIKEVSNIEITGLISNTYLGEQTTVQGILQGYEIVRKVAQENSLKILAICVPTFLENEFSSNQQFDVPIVSIKRYLTLPWEGKENG